MDQRYQLNMAKSKPLTIKFPVGGVSERFGYQQQAPFTTPGANNVWPTQWDTGRQRGGTRPGLTEIASTDNAIGTPPIGTPVGWCEATWESSGTHYRGVAVVTFDGSGDGTWVTTDGETWAHRITTDPSNDRASCAVYNQKLYQASVSQSTPSWYDLDTGASGSAIGGLGAIYPSIVVTWGDRLILGGLRYDPHQLWMSRIGDATDWDHTAVDPGAPVGTAGLNGVIGEPITSVIPHNGDCLIVGCTDSMYALRGNPRANGQFYKLTNQIGPLSQTAWCKTGNDFTFFMSRDGLYYIRPGCGEPPVSVSREKLPDDLVGIDPTDTDLKRVSLGYDARFRGIHILISYGTAADVYYFYDLQSEGFWPMSFVSYSPQLAVPLKSISTASSSELMLLDPNEDVLVFDTTSPTETDIDSHLWYGPIAIGTPHTEGILNEITAILSEDSGNVSWGIYADNSPQEAFNLGSASYTGGDWTSQGLNYNQHPRTRGVAAYIKVEDSSNSRWSIEEIVATKVDAGRRRL